MRKENQGNGKSNKRSASIDDFYDEIIITCLSLLGIKDMLSIERMTLREYDLRLRAWEKARIYRDYDIHLQAWCNALAQSTKQAGKKTIPVYKTFTQFFDLNKRLNEKPKENQQISRYKEFLMKKKGG